MTSKRKLKELVNFLQEEVEELLKQREDSLCRERDLRDLLEGKQLQLEEEIKGRIDIETALYRANGTNENYLKKIRVHTDCVKSLRGRIASMNDDLARVSNFPI